MFVGFDCGWVVVGVDAVSGGISIHRLDLSWYKYTQTGLFVV